MTDIDAIWSSLKSEDNGNSILQNLSTRKSKGVSSKRKQQIIAIKQQKQSFDIDSFTSSSQEVGAATTTAIEYVQTKECEALTDNLCELAVVFSALDHDSDDEEDEETQPSPDKQPLRTQRLVSALKSNDIASQIESVSKLNNAIK